MNSYVPIYRKWWFWVGVAGLTLLTFYVKWHFVLQEESAERNIRGAVQRAYVAIMEKRGEEMVAAQKADVYGGDTPEETLRLFVEALEKKDYELASRYFFVEDQKKEKESMFSSQYMPAYVSILKGKKVGTLFSDGVTSEFKFFDTTGKTIHIERLVLNEYTKKWKIESL